jgi:MraZ protein
MLFSGTYELSIDPKNRLSIPAHIRGGMDPQQDGARFYMVPGRHDGTLVLYPDKYFERYAEECHRGLDEGQAKDDFELIYFAMATPVDIDKQGRVVVPQWMLEKVGIGKQVSLTGARDHLVLWDRVECQKYLERNWSRHAVLQDLARKPKPAASV